MKAYHAEVHTEGNTYVARIHELHANTEADTLAELKDNLVDTALAAGAYGEFLVGFRHAHTTYWAERGVHGEKEA